MSGFPTSAPLAELVTIYGGGTPTRSNPDYYDGEIPWVTPKDMKSWEVSGAQVSITERGLRESATRLVPASSVLLVVRSGILKHSLPVAIAKRPIALNQDMKALVCNGKLLPEYLARFLQASAPTILKWVRATTADNFSVDKLKALPVPLPPLDEQRRIAAILDAADSLRAKRRAALAKLDQLAQSIFIEMFGVSSQPENSHGCPLSEFAEIQVGYPFPSAKYCQSGDGVKLCRGANILPGRLEWSDLATWPINEIGKYTEFNLKADDIVIAMDRPWISGGFKIARISDEDLPALLLQRVARIRGADRAQADFLYYLLRQPGFTAHCKPTETTVPHISPREIRSFRINWPRQKEVQGFSDRMKVVESLSHAGQYGVQKLDALFASLQHQAFRGEL